MILARIFRVETVLVALVYLPMPVQVGRHIDVIVHRVSMGKIVTHVRKRSCSVKLSFNIDCLFSDGFLCNDDLSGV